MYTKKIVSMFLITIFTTANIYAGKIVCKNCVVKIKHNENDNSVKFKSFKVAYNTQNPDDPNYIIPLDDNEPTSEDNDTIVLIDKTIKNNNSILSGNTLYACEDTQQQTLICDNQYKVCECV